MNYFSRENEIVRDRSCYLSKVNRWLYYIEMNY